MLESRVRLGEVLVAMGAISAERLASALDAQDSRPGARLGTVLREMGMVGETDVVRALAVVHDLPVVDLSGVTISPDLARMVPRTVADRVGVLVYGRHGGKLLIAISDPVDVVALDDIRAITGITSLTVGLATRSDISAALDRIWNEAEDTDAVRAFVDENVAVARGAAEDDTEDAATIRLVDRLLEVAARERASDIHVEPHRNGVSVRLRVDGMLREVLDLPAAGFGALSSRLKIIAGLDIIERRLPQDGRARVRVPGGYLDARVSTLPSLHGETVVVRLLPSSAKIPNLAGLGLPEDQATLLLENVARPQGLVLITGPTGSGKTNTLYATLGEGVDRTRKVITLEDPVEIELPGVTQVQIDERAGLDFARALRAALRQDPDVVLVGEIRDAETAALATRAALTGHLVLATLHTLDASASVSRLADMGVPGFLISSSLSLVVSQRLVRRPCGACAVADVEAPEVLRQHGVEDVDADWRKAVGCPACGGTGYVGRTAVLETLDVAGELGWRRIAETDEASIRAHLHAAGHRTLWDAGLDRARVGHTTLTEVLRSIPRPARR